MSSSTSRTVSLIFLLGIISYSSQFNAFADKMFSLSTPEYTARKTVQERRTFGRAFRIDQEEKMFVFTRNKFTKDQPRITMIKTADDPDTISVVDSAIDQTFEEDVEGNLGNPVYVASTIMYDMFVADTNPPGTDPTTPNLIPVYDGTIYDIKLLSLPPVAKNNFLILMRTGSGAANGNRGALAIGAFTIAPEDVPDSEGIVFNPGQTLPTSSKIFQVVAISLDSEPYEYEEPRLLVAYLENGATIILYGERKEGTTSPVGPLPTGFREFLNLAQLSNNIGGLDIEELSSLGYVQWEVRLLIALYDRPYSPLNGEDLVGVDSDGVISTITISNLNGAEGEQKMLVNLGMLVTDMIQSTSFYNKLICGHSGEKNIISIVHIGDEPALYYTIPQIDSNMNYIMENGIRNPFGTTVYMFLVYDSDRFPSESALYFFDYPIEDTNFPIELMKSEIDVGNDKSVMNDFKFFPDQGYIAIVGTDYSNDDPADFYLKAQIMCYRTCATCNGPAIDQCTTCPSGISLEVIQDGQGTCEEVDMGLTQTDLVADCGGAEIPRCSRCEANQPGFCQSCQIGAGLDELTDRGTGASCVQCPVENCMTCEMTPTGNFTFFLLFS